MHIEIIAEADDSATSQGERIRIVRQSRKMTQKSFSASLGIVQGFLCAIERGKKSPSATLLIALRHLYGLNSEWLEKGIGDMLLEKVAQISPESDRGGIPLLKESPKSDESYAQNLSRMISLPDIPDDCFAFEYTGDFMSPTIRDGDIVVIKPGSSPASGDIILIVGQWGDSFLRRYRVRGNDVFCSADNSSYSTFRFDPNTKILGIVYNIWRKIKI